LFFVSFALVRFGLNQLLTISTSSLSYLTRKTAFKRLNSDVPVTWRNPEAEVNEGVFEGQFSSSSSFRSFILLQQSELTYIYTDAENKKELVQDLTKKAKQVEYLIRALPDKEGVEGSVSFVLSFPLVLARSRN